MIYNNVLNLGKCSTCPTRNFCFLRKMPLQSYPEATQNFVIHLPSNIFSYSNVERRWHAHYKSIEDQIIAYYDTYNCYIPNNIKCPLSTEAQREKDRKFIREKFKHFLEIAAKATENTAPEASIIFDGIGLVLASDYIEAVHKTLSMFSKYDKMIKVNENACPLYSPDF